MDATLSYEDYEEQHLRHQNKVKTLDDVVLGSIRKPPPLIHGLLLDKTLTMISAEPFSGKTLLTIAMTVSLDAGLPLFDAYAVENRRKVLYMGQDAPSWDYAEQARKICRGHGLSLEQTHNLETDMLLNEGVNILDSDFLKRLQEWHNVSHFNVLFLDVLSSFHNADENDTRAMGVVMQILKRIRDQFLCAVIFTHHTAKPMGNDRSLNYMARGSSTIAGSIDFHLSLRRESATADRIRLRMPKGRGAEGLDALTYFDIVDVPHPDGPAIRLVVPDTTATRTGRILDFIKTRKSASRQEIITSVSASEPLLTGTKPTTATDNALALLSRAGKIKRAGRGIWEPV